LRLVLDYFTLSGYVMYIASCNLKMLLNVL
jgi:hypothetical protein